MTLHYHAQQRDDAPLWRYCREMSIPESLKHKMALFQTQGRLLGEEYELFAQGSWFQVMHGQGLRPRGYNAIVDVIAPEDISEFIEGIRRAVKNCLDLHADARGVHRQELQGNRPRFVTEAVAGRP